MKRDHPPFRLAPEIQGESILLLTALLWGLSFVSQRLGMRSIGPFAFNAVRFALGSVCLLPLIFLSRSRGKERPRVSSSILAGLICGIVLFLGATLQQVGVVSTSAGKAGFITGIYVILVPILGLFFKKRASWGIWAGAVLALAGLFFLSVRGDFTMGTGDLLVLAGAFFWAVHILVIGRFSNAADGLIMSSTQFMTCAALSLCVALPFERFGPASIAGAALPILYSGIVSIGVAFTLQIYGQKRAHPGRASIIMSMESLFAAVFGILFLGEDCGWRTVVGSLLILSGMVVAQLDLKRGRGRSVEGGR